MKHSKGYVTAKNTVVAQIIKDLETTGRAIVRGLGTFKLVTHKGKVNNFGSFPERQLVRFTATPGMREVFNRK